jgi:diphosphate--fructose-6-phosphate 1-phosphotransferase
VIVGIYEYIKKRNPNSLLFGFLNGPIGIIKGNYVELRDDTISFYKNRGGFDMIRSGRNKIEQPEEFESSLKHCQNLKLDGLVVIGGDDSNTNACLLAEYFESHGCQTKVIGCPKTIDGDLKNDFIEVSFGFDTACKTYSELIGNIMLDTLSTKKYYHFIRLMGRSASHICLECALLARPNYAFIGEEVEFNKVTLG